MGRRRSRRKRGRLRVGVAWSGATLILCAWFLGLTLVRLNGPAADEVRTVEVHIPRGATAREVVARMEEVGLAPHPRLAYWAWRFKGTFDGVQAGRHAFPARASILDLATLLTGEPVGPGLSLTLIPGETVWQAARRFQRAGVGVGAEVLARAEERQMAEARGLPVGPARHPRPDGVSQTYLEGFLFPDTYFFDDGTTTEEALARVTDRFRAVWREVSKTYRSDLRAVQTRYGLSVFQIIVLASLVEREVRDPSEGPRVAGVFYNRLERGMRLQTDPTLTYRPDRVGRAPTPDDRRDRTNPYNTYAIEGLPPGPISSPARGALEAAIRPERHDLLYFVSRGDAMGTHDFSRTLEEHQAKIVRYLRAREGP